MSTPTSDEVLDRIVERVNAGESVRSVCAELHVSPNTLRRRRADQLRSDLQVTGAMMGGRARAAQIPAGTGWKAPILASPKIGKFPDYSKGESH